MCLSKLFPTTCDKGSEHSLLTQQQFEIGTADSLLSPHTHTHTQTHTHTVTQQARGLDKACVPSEGILGSLQRWNDLQFTRPAQSQITHTAKTHNNMPHTSIAMYNIHTIHMLHKDFCKLNVSTTTVKILISIVFYNYLQKAPGFN